MYPIRLLIFLMHLKFVTAFTAILISLASSAAQGLAATNDASASVPTIRFDNVKISEAIKHLAEQADVNYIFDPKVVGDESDPHQKPEPRIIVNWTNVTPYTALTNLLAIYRMRLLEITGTAISKITFLTQTVGTVDLKWIRGDTNAPISLIGMEDMPVNEALQMFAEHGNLALLLGPSSNDPAFPGPEVTLNCKKVTPRQGIAAICETFDLVLTKDAVTGAFRITPRKPIVRLKSRYCSLFE